MTDEDRARWIRLVADFEASDLTQREFAIERGVSFTNLRNWIYRLRGQAKPLSRDDASEPSQQPESDAPEGGSRLVPVRVVASAAKPRRRVPPATVGDGLLELVLPSGAAVRFPAGTDPQYLQAITAALLA